MARSTDREIDVKDVRKGAEVRTSDGQKVATVFGPSRTWGGGEDYVIAESGMLFFKKTMYIPRSCIESIEPDAVVLALDKSALDQQDWSTRPDASGKDSRKIHVGVPKGGSSDGSEAERRRDGATHDGERGLARGAARGGGGRGRGA